MTKKVLLIIASKGFQPVEYKETKKILDKAGYFVTTASDKNGQAISSDNKEYNIDLSLSEVNAKDFDGIFIIGGPGAMECLDNKETYHLIRNIDKEYQLFGGICIAPRIFINADLMSGRYFTGWNNDKKLEQIAKNAGAYYIQQHVVTDGNLITASGPEAATEFGEEIVRKFKDNF